MRIGMVGVVLLLLWGCAPAPAPRTADSVVAAFQARGLEAEHRPLTRDDYGMAPFLCAEGSVRLLIPSLGDDQGGRIFQCPSGADAAQLKAYYDALGESSALFFSYTYQRDAILVQLSGDLAEATAAQYEEALRAMP